MPKILSVVGARPQFIKAAPVTRALEEQRIDQFCVHTGQHYDPQMSEIFFAELGIPAPNLNLNVGSGSHAVQTAAMLTGLERVISAEKPDWVLVYGDTNSTLAGVLAAAKLNVPVAHVEAGLRSFNRQMPEEINRVVADVLATLLFVPTEVARQNLLREGVAAERIYWTGDVMLDATQMFRERALSHSKILDELGLRDSPFVLATVHRAENTEDPLRLRSILEGLNQVAKHLRVILPLHPRTRARLEGSPIDISAIQVVSPLGFLDMMALEMTAEVIATDSGGVQKEAFFHRIPCVTLRTETEWTELLELGWNRLIFPGSAQQVADGILQARGQQGRAGTPYGDAHASDRIARSLRQTMEEPPPARQSTPSLSLQTSNTQPLH